MSNERGATVLDLNSPKRSSINDHTPSNGPDNNSSPNGSERDQGENGSQLSIKTEDLNSDQSKSVADSEGPEDQKEGLVNGEESEGVYDLAPRSTDTYSKKMQAYNNMNEEDKEEMRR